MELKIVSEDERRILSEFGEGGTWKVCKILEAKNDCIVGDHYHMKKDEMFVLLSGSGIFCIGDNAIAVSAPYSAFVRQGTYHLFRLSKGSILIGLASEVHDPKDDYKI